MVSHGYALYVLVWTNHEILVEESESVIMNGTVGV